MTREEEEEEVVVTAGEDKEEAEDKVGGAVGTATPLCERFKYSRSVGAGGETLSTEAMEDATATQ